MILWAVLADPNAMKIGIVIHGNKKKAKKFIEDKTILKEMEND